MNELEFIREAAKEAEKAVQKNAGGPFGAVIVRKGKIIAKGHNLVLKTNDPTMHAEIIAIRRASKKLKRFNLNDCEVYSSCEPCPMCLAAIYWARIKKMYYGCTQHDAEHIGFDDKLFHDIFKGKKKGIENKQIGREICLKAFEQWKKKKDKVMY